MFKSEEYINYLHKHINAVQQSYQLLLNNKVFDFNCQAYENIQNHDNSKYSEEEFTAYGEYFYGDKKDINHKEDIDFKYAWLNHQHHNPHHWQYWCLKEDDSDQLEALPMPKEYVQEMICDWLSFSLNKGNLSEIHEWYEKNKSKQLLHEDTRKLVEEYLKKIRSIKL